MKPIEFPNYKIVSQIYESSNSIVYRGIRTENGQAVILKVLREDYPTPEELSRYRQEFDITRGVSAPGVIGVYSLEKFDNTRVIVTEDFNGESLSLLMEKPVESGGIKGISPDAFLPMGIRIAESLRLIHAENIIHKDINPSNIVWNPGTQQLKIIDFGIATRLPRETPVLMNPTRLEGTLAYISPEQTGRMNRSIDYRTDLYSLGVTFYELLTGKLPFTAETPMALVHCHLAKTPVPVCDVNPAVPPVLSDIVMKLMSKNAEDRYQSAYGVKADLERCLKEPAGFTLGQQDVSGEFHIPQRLYGREKEIGTLLGAFGRISRGLDGELLLVAGYSGVGKSALVHEVHKPITEKRGYFISGKFEQFKRNIPYSALTQSLNEFCDYLLTGNAGEMAKWRERILSAVGDNGQVLIDFIPHLELVIGPQPPVAHLGAAEAQNRINWMFQKFFRAISQKEHPLVLFMDDLQWADEASLSLLKVLLTDTRNRYLLPIGAYRDNEVDDTHPLMFLVAALKRTRVAIHTIHVENLSHRDVNRLISDTLHSDILQTRLLADLVYEKTLGNAFFVLQFLRMLHDEGILRFDEPQGRWSWSFTKTQAMGVTDNVVSLMSRKIERLPVATQSILRIAACVGNQFNLTLPSLLMGQTPQVSLELMKAAITASLVFPVGKNYEQLVITKSDLEETTFRFIHDRVQQAAYQLIPESERNPVHLKIGRLMLAHSSQAEIEEKIFDIVRHFKYGGELLTDTAEQRKLSTLYAMAGHRAKAAAAYHPALDYYHDALKLSSRDWRADYAFLLELYENAAEAAFLAAAEADLTQFADAVFENAKNEADKVEIYRILIQKLNNEGQFVEAIDLGLDALEKLGYAIPRMDNPADAVSAMREFNSNTREQVGSLADQPQMMDQTALKATEMMATIIPSTFITSRMGTCLLLLINSLRLYTRLGNGPVAPYVYALYGGFINIFLNQVPLAETYANIALRLCADPFYARNKARGMYIVALFVYPWTTHPSRSMELFLEALKAGRESGDMEFEAYATYAYVLYSLWSGVPLPKVRESALSMMALTRRQQMQTQYTWTASYEAVVCNFMESSPTPHRLSSDFFDEDQHLPPLIDSKDNYGLGLIYTNKLWLAYLFGNADASLELIETLEAYEMANAGMYLFAGRQFYTALALLAHGDPEADPAADRVNRILADMKAWAAAAPMNFQHKFDLVQAEKARVSGQDLAAMDLYEQAIAGARKNEYLHEEALAYELAARFYKGRGMEKFAQTYLKEAQYRYELWGCTAKVNDIAEKYPRLVDSHLAAGTTNPSKKAEDSTTNQLDLNAVMQAAQTISGEIVLTSLIEKMMRIVIENAGAQRGFLILNQEDLWLVQAQLEVDPEMVALLSAVPLEPADGDNRPSPELSVSIVNYVIRTRENVVLNDASREGPFTRLPYIARRRPLSILCMPLINQGKVRGIIYLENNISTGAFTSERLSILNLLSSQMAISLDNAMLYDNLENLVSQRTRELSNTLDNLQTTQSRLVQAKEAAEVANQAKSEFLSNMSHELRTPLNGILGYTQILGRDKGLTPLQKDGLDIIHRSGEHLLTLINDILDLSKIEALKMELYPNDFYFPDFLNGICDIIRVRATQKNIAFFQESPAGLPAAVRADEKRLRQILINLLGNAVKFTNKGSVRLTVKAGETKTQENGPPLSLIRFEISDTGIGMTSEEINTIFLPFEQAGDVRHRADGTGLGLSICRRLVEMMGSEIEVTSRPGSGTTFRFELELPVPAVDRVDAGGSDRRIVGYKGKRRTLLVADDKISNRSLLISLLEPLGFSLVSADNGQAAVEKAREVMPDVILMDLVMPVRTGFEAVQAIRRNDELDHVIIIAVSASVFDEDQEKSRLAGCEAFLPKPVRADQLLGILQKHLKLEWEYEEQEQEAKPTEKGNPATQVALVVPPAREMARLHELALLGNMKKIKNRASEIEKMGRQYLPFARKLRHLARNFDEKAILDLMEQFMEAKK